MFKFVLILATCVVLSSGGIIGHHGLALAPLAVHAPHHAESWQNNNLVALHPTPVVVSHAPVAKVALAAPLIAPYAHGPALSLPLAHGLPFGHGFHH